MNPNKKISIREEVRELAETVDTNDEISGTSLQISALKLELERVRLQQEQERLKRLQKNSKRRPLLFWSLAAVIFFFYGGFFAMVLGGPSIGIDNECLSESASKLYIAEIFLLSVVPTVLVALLMKAVFSATEKKEDRTSEIKISDAVPIKVIAENLTK